LSQLDVTWRQKVLTILCIWHDLNRDVQLDFTDPRLPIEAADRGIDVRKRPLVGPPQSSVVAGGDPTIAAPWEGDKQTAAAPKVETADPSDPFADVNLDDVSIEPAGRPDVQT
jgi:hypothetical protein